MRVKYERLHNPELISIDVDASEESGYGSGFGYTKKHVPYGKIDEELTYNINKEPKLKRIEDLGYKLNERNFSNIKELFSEDYKKFDFSHHKDNDGVYIGAEHCNKDSSVEEILQKKCNLTFFGNLEAKLDGEKVIVMASSMGHHHPRNLEIQEIYEFQGYGIMVIDKSNRKENAGIDLVFMKPGGKVIVPGNCNMTIYNLQLEPLETHDFANPKRNESSKDLQKQKGPILCIYYAPKKETIFFDFNTEYLRKETSPSRVSIPVKILEGENMGKKLFNKAKDEDFKKQFGNINVLICDEHPLPPEIPRNKSLKEIIKYKSSEFCSLFNIK